LTHQNRQHIAYYNADRQTVPGQRNLADDKFALHFLSLTTKEDTATPVGTYTVFASLATMLASFTAGLIWKLVSPEATFLLAATGAGWVKTTGPAMPNSCATSGAVPAKRA
jgi:hypothetical protein